MEDCLLVAILRQGPPLLKALVVTQDLLHVSVTVVAVFVIPWRACLERSRWRRQRCMQSRRSWAEPCHHKPSHLQPINVNDGLVSCCVISVHFCRSSFDTSSISRNFNGVWYLDKKAVMLQGNRAMQRVFAYAQWLFGCYYFTFTA